jgi:hypothetical protein
MRRVALYWPHMLYTVWVAVSVILNSWACLDSRLELETVMTRKVTRSWWLIFNIDGAQTVQMCVEKLPRLRSRSNAFEIMSLFFENMPEFDRNTCWNR